MPLKLEARLKSGSEWFVTRTYKTEKARGIAFDTLRNDKESRFEYRIPKDKKASRATY